MFEFWRTWFGERRQTSPSPPGAVQFPARFRGRPVIDCADGPFAVDEFVRRVPTGSIQRGRAGLPVLDLGACLFSPEEAVEAGGCRCEFSSDVRMGARTRDELVVSSGELQLARAFGAKMCGLLGRSLRLRSVVAGSCGGCESELAALSNVVFDMARFGIEFVSSPRHADGIVITGVVNRNMVAALERTYAAVPDPRIVVAVGACAASGGPFRGSGEIVGIPATIPVDLWIPGCPPHPLTVLDGLLRLLGRLNQVNTSRSSDAP